MIIVTGHLVVDPADRDHQVTLSAEAVRAARATPGCLDFAVSADSCDPSRVNVAERWANRACLEEFRGSGPDDDLGSLVREFHVDEYEIEHR